MPDWVKLLGIVVGSLGVAIAFIKSFLFRYNQLQDKIEAQTRNHITEKFDDLEESLRELKSQVFRVETVVAELNVKQASNRERSEKVLKALEEFVKDTEKRFKDLENSEIVQLGKESWMLKKRG